MMQWKNNKGYTVRETERYIRTYFVDTKYNRIMLIEDKEDHEWFYEIKNVKSPGSKKPGFFYFKTTIKQK